MKKQILKSIFLLLTVILVVACSNSDSGKSLPNTPSAKAQYDASNYGVYKGVFIGSSGTIILDISNGANSFTATLVIDGVTHTFMTNQTIQQNQATTINFIEGNNSFTFSVAANGSNPTITDLIINGHPDAAILVVKETSSTLIKCFEGTFSGTYSGTFNAVIYGNVIKGITRETNDVDIVTADGTVNNNQINASGNASNGAVFLGNLTTTNFSGTWSRSSDNANGTFTGVRTY